MKQIELSKRVGLALRRRREALRLSQEQFAERVHMHRVYYSSVERGLKNIRVKTLERLCGALKTPIRRILKDAESP